MNKVKTLKAITMAASIALVMSFILGCSDDKDSFGSCSEVFNAMVTCDDELRNNAELMANYNICLSTAISLEDEDACEELMDEPFEKCMMNSGICGGASSEKCMEHFDKECGWDD